MNEPVLHLRILENKDWITALFVLTLVLIVYTKTAFENRFSEFTKLLYTGKYIKMYRDNSHLTSRFTIFLFVVQIVSLSFFIQLFLNSINLVSKNDWMSFAQILTFVTYIILAKFLIDKIIADSFNIEDFVVEFNLTKVMYRSYIGVFLFPVNIILYYYDVFSKSFYLFILFGLLLFNIFVYIIAIKNYQKLILSKLFYFILYLCGLEIAPFYLIYYWFTKWSA